MKLSQLFSSTRTPRSTPAMQEKTVESPAGTDEHGVRPTDSSLDLFGITHPGFLEILPYTVIQPRCFANINSVPGSVLVEVYSWTLGQLR